jgi:methionyl-tRNA formyltransferase
MLYKNTTWKISKKNKLTLIFHPSKLPRNKGFSPIQYEALNNKNQFYISLIKAVKEVDAGPIILQNKLKLKGDKLSKEIRYIQGKQILKIIKQFLLIYPKFKFRTQTSKSNFNKRRYPKDSRLNINKIIKKQFNHLRINDNDLYLSFFNYKKTKYIIKIFKEK